MKPIFRPYATAVLVPLLLATASQLGCGGEVFEMTVEHYKQPCYGMFKRLCMQVDDGDGLGNFYDPIEGFEFEWGYVYRLRVERDDLFRPPMDGSSVEYTLEEVLEKTRVAADTTFQMPVEPASDDPELSVSGDQDGTLLDGTLFVCESAAVCSEISDALQGTEPFAVEFGYTTTTGAPSLVARRIPSESTGTP